MGQKITMKNMLNHCYKTTVVKKTKFVYFQAKVLYRSYLSYIGQTTDGISQSARLMWSLCQNINTKILLICRSQLDVLQGDFYQMKNTFKNN